jgi:Domain of unknown function (DUF222)
MAGRARTGPGAGFEESDHIEERAVEVALGPEEGDIDPPLAEVVMTPAIPHLAIRRMPDFVRGRCETRGVTVAVSEPMQLVSSCLDDLRSGLSGLDDRRIIDALRQVEEISRRAQSAMLDVVAEVDARSIAAREGFGTTPRLLAATLRLSAAEARARTEQAAMVGPRRAMTGETLAPRLPVTAAALAAGEIGAGQLRVITETMAALPASVPEPAREQVEADLAGYARDFDPRRLRLIAHRLITTLDPDGPEPGDDSTATTPVRGELWLRDRRDGRLGLEGWLDAEHGATVRLLIEQLAARHPTDDGAPDIRTVPERHADALIELCDRARAVAGVPHHGWGTPARDGDHRLGRAAHCAGHRSIGLREADQRR